MKKDGGIEMWRVESSAVRAFADFGRDQMATAWGGGCSSGVVDEWQGEGCLASRTDKSI